MLLINQKNLLIILSKVCADYGITINHSSCFAEAQKVYKDITNSFKNYNKESNLHNFVGGTTVSVYKAVEEIQNEDFFKNSDAIVILGCEGNIDEKYINYFKK